MDVSERTGGNSRPQKKMILEALRLIGWWCTSLSIRCLDPMSILKKWNDISGERAEWVFISNSGR
jgi:hypothetical protein